MIGNSSHNSGLPEQIDYSLQEGINSEREILRVPESVSIVGTGGFGAWAALLSAMAGVKELVLFDPATVDSQDIARIPFRLSQVGAFKVNALRDLIIELRPNASVSTFAEAFDSDRHADHLRGLVFNGVSSAATDKSLWELCARRGYRCVSGYYNGLRVGVSNSPVVGLTFPESLPVWPGSSALSAVLAIYSAFVTPVNFFGSIESLSLPEENISHALQLFSEGTR